MLLVSPSPCSNMFQHVPTALEIPISLKRGQQTFCRFRHDWAPSVKPMQCENMWKKCDQPLWTFHSFPQRWSMSDKSRIIGFLDKVFRDSNPTLALLTSLACSARSDSCLMITLSSHCPPRSKTWSCFCLTIENLALGHTLPVQYKALYKSTMIKKTRW